MKKKRSNVSGWTRKQKHQIKFTRLKIEIRKCLFFTFTDMYGLRRDFSVVVVLVVAVGYFILNSASFFFRCSISFVLRLWAVNWISGRWKINFQYHAESYFLYASASFWLNFQFMIFSFHLLSYTHEIYTVYVCISTILNSMNEWRECKQNDPKKKTKKIVTWLIIIIIIRYCSELFWVVCNVFGLDKSYAIQSSTNIKKKNASQRWNRIRIVQEGVGKCMAIHRCPEHGWLVPKQWKIIENKNFNGWMVVVIAAVAVTTITAIVCSYSIVSMWF